MSSSLVPIRSCIERGEIVRSGKKLDGNFRSNHKHYPPSVIDMDSNLRENPAFYTVFDSLKHTPILVRQIATG